MIPRVIVLAFGLFCCFAAEAQFQSVRVQVIDRGQADGILIRTPNQRWVVIDAGTNRQQADAMKNIWGVDRVALAVVSHRHGDHYGGMEAILQDFDVDQFLGVMENCPNRTTDDTIRSIIASKGIEVHPLDSTPIEIDGVRFTILPRDPIENECPEEENNNSVIVRMDFGEFSMLFTGDAETEEREWLMANHPDLLDVDVLKASHHGSRNGADGEVNGEDWMDVVSPDAVVISAPHGMPLTRFVTRSRGRCVQMCWREYFCTWNCPGG
jgi:competence protein ComEC